MYTCLLCSVAAQLLANYLLSKLPSVREVKKQMVQCLLFSFCLASFATLHIPNVHQKKSNWTQGNNLDFIRFQDPFEVAQCWDNPSPPLTLGICQMSWNFKYQMSSNVKYDYDDYDDWSVSRFRIFRVKICTKKKLKFDCWNI